MTVRHTYVCDACGREAPASEGRAVGILTLAFDRPRTWHIVGDADVCSWVCRLKYSKGQRQAAAPRLLRSLR